MYVCICHALTDRDITAVVLRTGAKAESAVRRFLEAPVLCGRCCESFRETIASARAGVSAGAGAD